MKKLTSYIILIFLVLSCVLKNKTAHAWDFVLDEERHNSVVIGNSTHQYHQYHQHASNAYNHFHYDHNDSQQKSGRGQPVDAHHNCHPHIQIDCCFYYDKLKYNLNFSWNISLISFKENSNLYRSIFLDSNFRPPILT